MLKNMHQSLTDLLCSRKLFWNPSDLKVMSTAVRGVRGYDLKTVDPVTFAPTTLPVLPCDEFVILGILLRKEGSSLKAMNY